MEQLISTARAWMAHRQGDGLLRITVGGEIDVASLAELAGGVDDLLRSEVTEAVIDLGGVTFMDSSGVALLIRLSKHFDPATIQGASPTVRRTLEALGLTGRLRIAPGATEAERSFAREFASVPDSRRYLTEVIGDLPAEVVDTARLLVSELSTNAVLHGGGDTFDVGIRFEPGRGELVVSATDAGGGHPRELRPDASEEHGRGLQLVSALADDWGVQLGPHDGTKVVWFRMAVGGRDI